MMAGSLKWGISGQKKRGEGALLPTLPLPHASGNSLPSLDLGSLFVEVDLE